MKKLLLTLSVLLMTAFNVYAQQQVGTFSVTPKLGINCSNYSGMPIWGVGYGTINTDNAINNGWIYIDNYDSSDANGLCELKNKSLEKFGFVIGAESQYQFSKVFGLSLGAYFSQQGCKYRNFDSSFGNIDSNSNKSWYIKINDDPKYNVNTLILPILANFYVWKGLSLKVGLQPEYILSEKFKCDADVVILEKKYDQYYVGIGNEKSERWSLSIPVGISYEYHNVVADLRYAYGVTDVVGDSKNRNLSFTLGYKFGL